MDKLARRLSEASSLSAVAAALWGAAAIAPEWLDGALGLAALDWRALVVCSALVVTLWAIARPEGGKQWPPEGGKQ